MVRDCIRQATCSECDENEDNLTVTNTIMGEGDEPFTYETRCRCGTTGSVELGGEGIEETENVHHDDASWTEESVED